MSALIYQQVTDTIIKQLESGAAPWVKQWQGSSSGSHNITSGKGYNGINTIILGMSEAAAGYKSSAWGTYKQWQALGAQVKKGTKGTTIIFYSPVTGSKVTASGEEKTYHYVLKSYSVFNADQVDGYTAPVLPVKTFNSIVALESLAVASGADIKHGGDKAFYSPSQDFIQMPNKTDFKGEAAYYATLLHELTHWSGAASRLNRDLSGRFGNEAYAAEELIAELSAAFLCASYQIDGDLRHAGYIASWLRVLKNDNKAIFKAAALAQKAADYIKAFASSEEAAQPVAEESELVAA
jgi:antirestriction protein ArdC